MSGAILLIHHDVDGKRTTYPFNKAEGVPFDEVTQLNQLIGRRPRLYITGLTALNTYKTLVPVLERLASTVPGSLTCERAQAGDYDGNATVGYHKQGRVRPKGTLGG